MNPSRGSGSGKVTNVSRYYHILPVIKKRKSFRRYVLTYARKDLVTSLRNVHAASEDCTHREVTCCTFSASHPLLSC
jgi:hypothetical protein